MPYTLEPCLKKLIAHVEQQEPKQTPIRFRMAPRTFLKLLRELTYSPSPTPSFPPKYHAIPIEVDPDCVDDEIRIDSMLQDDMNLRHMRRWHHDRRYDRR